jgi:hypothetical protein
MKALYRLSQCILILVVVMALTEAGSSSAFDFDNGNAPIEVVIPSAVPAIFEMSPGGNDASLVLRVTTLITNAWFDAIAPYHSTAVGVYSRLGRRPPSESDTNANKNTAILYASFHVLRSLFPHRTADWNAMLTSVGLDPADGSMDLTTPVGIGNAAGRGVVSARERDGMNQLGDEGRTYNRRPYADYTGYKPVNTAYELKDASRWQPNFVTTNNGIFSIQQFVTPQWGLTRPYSYQTPNSFPAPPPVDSRPTGSHRQAYQRQADEVLSVSANLTDYQKMVAELFDNKIFSLGFSALFISQSRNFTLDQFVHYDFLTNMAAFDAGIATWNQKAKWDAVRPFSAIRYLYGDRQVTAWGGPGEGTVTDIPASEWRSYLNTADHPEYPSGSACFCAAHAQASRRFLGSDQFGWSVPAAKGSSRIEPGITPAADIVLGPWSTWSDFEHECGLSRLWGGVHFMPSITEGAAQCKPIGDTAYEFLRKHLDGTAR